MTLKEELRYYIESKAKIVQPIALRTAKMLAGLGGIFGTSIAFEKGTDAYIKAKKARLKKLKSVSEVKKKKLKTTKVDEEYILELKKSAQLIWRHKKQLGKIVGKSSLAMIPWIVGEKILSTTAAVKKKEQQIAKLVRLRASKRLLKVKK